jgi:hypothetical protein
MSSFVIDMKSEFNTDVTAVMLNSFFGGLSPLSEEEHRLY